MIQRMKNTLLVTVQGVDLQTVYGLEFYVRQGPFFRVYSPSVHSTTEMAVTIPYEDAMQLAARNVRLQFAFTDANGIPDRSGIVEMPVDEFLKEAGYDPVRGQ